MPQGKELKILKRGVDVWNKWRRENPGVRPDLSGGDLAGMDLQSFKLADVDLEGFDLQRTDLFEADLRRANLRGANLERASLDFANLEDASLARARLASASLRWVNLRRTNLTRAHLVEADLWGCYLEDTDFSEAWLNSTRFCGVDFSTCRGLSKVWHLGYPRVTTSVLELTAQGVADHPENLAVVKSFFLDIGIEEWMIEGFAERVALYAQFDACSIVFPTSQRHFVGRLRERLYGRGIRFWRDERADDRKTYLGVYYQGPEDPTRVVLCCCRASLESWWIDDEIEKVLARERREGRPVLLAINLDRSLLKGWESPHAEFVRSRLVADFSACRRAAESGTFPGELEKLLAALRRESGGRQSST